MKIFIITAFPKIVSSFFEESILKKAQEKKLIEVNIIDLRNYAYDKRGSIDDRVYGGGKGMLLRVDVIDKALINIKNKIKNENTKILLTSPRGKIFDQKKAKQLSQLDNLIIICGHYEGVDERVKNFIDEEISIGDFINTGGEIAALTIADAVIRLIPGVLTKEAINNESFSQYDIDCLISLLGENKVLKKLKEKGIKKIKLLEYPQYTRPESYKNLSVPKILLSGNPKKIEKWRIEQAFEETLKRRKDLLI